MRTDLRSLDESAEKRPAVESRDARAPLDRATTSQFSRLNADSAARLAEEVTADVSEVEEVAVVVLAAKLVVIAEAAKCGSVRLIERIQTRRLISAHQ